MVARTLLMVTALAEAPIGVMLLFSPPLVARLLLGAPLDAPAASIVGRIAGGALLGLSVACWVARDDQQGLALRAGMLLYNCAALGVLAHAGAVIGLAGVLMWPAVAVHAALVVWCLACLRSGPVTAAG